MMKKFVFVIGLIFNVLLCSAQSPYSETLFLKNGSIIKGQVIEYVPNKNVTMVTPEGNKFVVEIENIEKYTREPVTVDVANNSISANVNDEPRVYSSSKGYKGFFGTEFMAGEIMEMGLSTVHGLNVTKNLFLGAGLALKTTSDEAYRIPLFADVRLDINNDKKASPFIDMRAGYEIIDESDNALYMSLNGGVRIRSLNISMGMDMSQVYDDYGCYYCGDDIDSKDSYKVLTLNLRIGFQF